ncbi:MAG TPA: hypothetical protein VHO06_12110 [Polyangia bacterium]|nr:hypothetical protein [Polyangia bacterium]
MRRAGAVAAALVLLAGASASAKKPKHHAPAVHRPAPTRTQERAVTPAPPPTAADESAGEGGEAAADDAKPAADGKAGGKTLKTKTYTFGAMDVEGKLKTPQLLYFLNRVKLELDMSAPDKRSFMKELAQSADDKSL